MSDTPNGTPAEADKAAFTRRASACWMACLPFSTEALEQNALAELFNAAEGVRSACAAEWMGVTPEIALQRLAAALDALKQGEAP